MSISLEEFASIIPGDTVRFVDRYQSISPDSSDVFWAKMLGNEHIVREIYSNCPYFLVYESSVPFKYTFIENVVRRDECIDFRPADMSDIESMLFCDGGA